MSVPSATTPGAVPQVVAAWALAWNENRPEELAARFDPVGVYEDLAFQASWTGPDQVTDWVTITHSSISAVRVEVASTFRSDDRIAVVWTFSGHMAAAPQPFRVPAATIMLLRDEMVLRISDYYNLAALLKQSGLPTDWTPPGS